MQEYHVTVAGSTHVVPRPFHVLATQNPLEQEGTYPLPEAQLDRFLMQIDGLLSRHRGGTENPAGDDRRTRFQGNRRAERRGTDLVPEPRPTRPGGRFRGKRRF